VVRRILHEEGLLLERESQEPAREHAPRRFERAMPNQLWHWTTSRFIVSYTLARQHVGGPGTLSRAGVLSAS
jgi:hypothetical protein